MRPLKYSADALITLFREQKVLTLPELKRALGTTVKMTVFRKLKELSSITSYSHAGQYYTLPDIANFSKDGLWSHNQVHFSTYGSLKNTVEALVRASEAGYFASELQALLHVDVYKALSTLASSGALVRRKMAGEYLYMSTAKQERQLEKRKSHPDAAGSTRRRRRAAEFESPAVREALCVFLTQLDEKQRRLYVGFESMLLGYGGDSIMAEVTGMNVKTVARGRRELLARDITPERVRKAGGGRIPVEKKRPS